MLIIKQTHFQENPLIRQKCNQFAIRSIFIFIYIIAIMATTASEITNISNVFAQDIRLVVRGSGYEIPRFLSIKSEEANMRVGPGNEYPILWTYKQKGLPLKIIAEYDVWRKVIDHDEVTGWMHSKLLTGRRTALITERVTKIYKTSEDNSEIVGYAEKNVIMELQYCKSQFCKVAHSELKGWIKRDSFWGLVEDEKLN